MRSLTSAQPITEDELNYIFSRESDHDALLVDDTISTPAGRVIAFRYHLPNGTTNLPKDESDIAILICGAEGTRELTIKIASSNIATRSGLRPPRKLGPGRACRLGQNDPANDFAAFLSRTDSALGTDTRTLLQSIAATGYDIWIVGGAVRDLVAGLRPPQEVNDLDLAGNIPFGRLYEGFLKRTVDKNQLDVRLTPTGVLHSFIVKNGRRYTWFQYAALKHVGFFDHKQHNQLWFGGSMQEDSQWRDLTINSLFYDVNTNILFDPTGHSIADLKARELRPIQPVDWPGQAARALFRTLKFAYKYRSDGFTMGLARDFMEANTVQCCSDFLSRKIVEQSNIVMACYGGREEMRHDRDLTRIKVAGDSVGLTGPEWERVLIAAENAVFGPR